VSVNSPDFPVVSGFDAGLNGTQDALVGTFGPRGLFLALCLGGSGFDNAEGIALCSGVRPFTT